MSKKHNPLNEAMVAQILHHLRNGEVRRCLDMGLDPEILALLQQPSSQSVLLNSAVIWCRVAVDPDMVKRLLANKERTDQENRIVQRALRLGATTPMLQEFFGMSPQEVSLQRVLVGVPGRPGRFRDIPDDAPLWHRFVQLMEEYSVDHTDGVALLDIAMMLTEEINVPPEEPHSLPTDQITLGLVWNKIQGWLAQDLYPNGKKRKSASLVMLGESRQQSTANANRSRPGQSQANKSVGKVEGDRM
ncbi:MULTISPECIES: DUF2857 domain-containing protein [Pseudomonas syringae group]|uniref:DUF2857 domain-containing protein n=1 Tax=Pseudomonas syringae group TaxID=136849 RepID=UPI0001BC8D0D|nr:MULTISPECIES: DUF2857 domain-containing protein [Pseudomonas syringae group]KEZ68355.1 hypothetical protein C1E_0211635 [Pseudomonas amygdali pv. tabaci str. ATCC 11528]MDU8543623.1 DUF2857 domain-containing protein [Pseudomonas syringae group sp. J248-6]QED82958.1 DUF2857 domain-containing protein [Pseudomonas amygdali pv. tabaci str. ATCC 11528]